MISDYTTTRGKKLKIQYPEWMQEELAFKVVQGCLDGPSEYWQKRCNQLGVEVLVGNEGYEVRQK